jgi:hypothetical protein
MWLESGNFLFKKWNRLTSFEYGAKQISAPYVNPVYERTLPFNGKQETRTYSLTGLEVLYLVASLLTESSSNTANLKQKAKASCFNPVRNIIYYLARHSARTCMKAVNG